MWLFLMAIALGVHPCAHAGAGGEGRGDASSSSGQWHGGSWGDSGWRDGSGWSGGWRDGSGWSGGWSRGWGDSSSTSSWTDLADPAQIGSLDRRPGVATAGRAGGDDGGKADGKGQRGRTPPPADHPGH